MDDHDRRTAAIVRPDVENVERGAGNLDLLALGGIAALQDSDTGLRVSARTASAATTMIEPIENVWRMILCTDELRFQGATVAQPIAGFPPFEARQTPDFIRPSSAAFYNPHLPAYDVTGARRRGCNYLRYPHNPQGNARDAKDLSQSCGSRDDWRIFDDFQTE
jgi:hypothetical protein